MHRPISLVAVAALTIACTDGITDPGDHARAYPTFSSHAEAPPAVTSLTPVSVGTGVDQGPQDGVYDVFSESNLGSVNNNGYTSFATAFEFELISIPAGASLTEVEFQLVLDAFEGPRTVAVHGYRGDGAVQLTDIASTNLLGVLSVDGTGPQPFMLEVTSFLVALAAEGATHVGIVLREEPPNEANFVVMNVELPSVALSVGYVSELVVEILVKPSEEGAPLSSRASGRVPVAILSSADLNAFDDIDRTSLTFGVTGSEDSLVGCAGDPSDVNGDGLPDLVCHFDVAATDVGPLDDRVTIRGKTLGGAVFRGEASVRLVG